MRLQLGEDPRAVVGDLHVCTERGSRSHIGGRVLEVFDVAHRRSAEYRQGHEVNVTGKVPTSEAAGVIAAFLDYAPGENPRPLYAVDDQVLALSHGIAHISHGDGVERADRVESSRVAVRLTPVGVVPAGPDCGDLVKQVRPHHNDPLHGIEAHTCRIGREVSGHRRDVVDDDRVGGIHQAVVEVLDVRVQRRAGGVGLSIYLACADQDIQAGDL